MGELGEQSEQLHASIGEHLKKLSIDVVITIGTLSEAIHKAALQNVPQSTCLHYKDKATFLTQYQEILQKRDAILIKASHYMEFEEIVKILSEDERLGQ